MKLNAREKALELVEGGFMDPSFLLECCLKYMSCEDIEDMFAANDLQFEEEEISYEE
jgi:hypothetical protein